MGRPFRGIWRLVESASVLPDDAPEVQRRKTTLVAVALLSCAMGPISVLHSYAAQGLNADIVMPAAYTLVVGAALVTFLLTKRFALLLYPFLLMILCTPVAFQWSTGGLSVPGATTIVLWAALAPLGALMFLGVRQAVWWFAAFATLVALTLALDEHFAPLATPIGHGELMLGHGLNIVGLATTIFFTVVHFVNAFQREHDKVGALVSELTETNQTLESTIRELEATQTELVQAEKTSAIGKLAAGIAHEINNPIGAIGSAADVSSRCVSRLEELISEEDAFADVRDNRRFRSYLEALRDNGGVLAAASARVTDAVTGFARFARLDEAEFGSADLAEGVESALALVQRDMASGVSIVRDYGDIPQVMCFPGELNQVFLNLLARAAGVVRESGSITIRTFAEAGFLCVQIVDTGTPIHPDEIPRLFDPEFHRDGRRVRADMGMVVSRTIIEKHNGQIDVGSGEGRGTTFTVRVPTDLTGERA